MSRLALRIAKLARLRAERDQVVFIVNPNWAVDPGKPTGVIGLGRRLSEDERAKLLAEAVAEWEAERQAAQDAPEAAGGPNVPEASPPPSALPEDA